MGPSFVNALEMERRALRIDTKEQLILEMETALSDWQFVADAPENAVVLARRNVGRLKRTLRVLKKERKKEVRLALGRLAAIGAPSRSNRISLVSHSIAQIISSLEAQKTKELAILVFATMAFLGGALSSEPQIMTYVTMIGGFFAFRAWNVLKEIKAKRRWMGVYMGALNQLEFDPKLTVRNAVRGQLMEDPIFRDKCLNSAGIKNILGQIPDARVVGDPNEIEPAIPGELLALTNQAQEPARFFSKL